MAQEAVQVWTSLGFQSISLQVLTASTLTVPPGARWAWICAEAAPARWRDDGATPTSVSGMLLVPTTSNGTTAVQNCLRYSGAAMTTQASINLQTTNPILKFMANTTGAILNVSYYQ